jgi:protein-disulfide isomerase
MTENQNPNSNNYLMPISIILAAILIAGALVYNVGSKEAAKPSNDNKELALVEESINPSIIFPKINDSDAVLGDQNAPVTIFIYGDYQCPVCKVMFDEVERKIQKDYVETGKVKLIFRDFPLDQIHPYARAAAEAVACANEQGKFWEYHDVLFERQENLSETDFIALAQELGLDKNQFEFCYNARKYQKEVQSDLESGIKAGVQGTPATFINNEFISGISRVEPYQIFKTAIEEQLTTNN